MMLVFALRDIWKSEMKRFLLILLWCTSLKLWAAEAVTIAADDDTASNSATEGAIAEDSAAAGASATATPEASAGEGTIAADDTFVPTVEISEDLSVSFPTDI